MENYKDLQEIFKEKVNRDITDKIENDIEFYYVAGQCISFMCNRFIKTSRTLNKNAVSKQVMLAKDTEELKKKLKMFLGKCSNMLYMEDKAFNNAFAMLLGYVPDTNTIDYNALQYGYTSNCLL